MPPTIVNINNAEFRPQMAAFDYDWTLVNPKDGKKLWGYPWKTKYGVNSADPILLGDKVFISSGYDRGCALLKVDGTKVTKIWENKNMCNHFNACVLIDGYLYGFSGNTGRGTLRCLEMATGEMKWEEKSFGGFGALQAIGKNLLIISNQGELVVADSNPETFTHPNTPPVILR